MSVTGVAIQRMCGRRLRRLVSLAVTGAIAVSANLAPAHGHPATSGHTAVVHRHASLHIVQTSGHPRLCDSDGAIIWIDESYLPGSTAIASPPAFIVGDSQPVPAFTRISHPMPERHASRIHGPPRGPNGSRPPPARVL